MFIVPRDVARNAISGQVRTYDGGDLLLLAEVISPRGHEYALDAEIRAGHTLTASQPFAISFDPGALTELE